MKLYNTQSRKLEGFTADEGKVGVYTCGITPYDTTHLGHAFTYVMSDILIRYLQWVGYTVTYVENVTDIDDDILRKARQVGEDWHRLGNRWTAHFIEDMKSLNVLPPNFFPRATDVIPQIQETVEKLIESGVAYECAGNVYFDINSWQEFGKLSGLDRDQMLPLANQRGNNPDDPNKRSPLDFVLWQAKKENEPAWQSPWGPGRPGWHIECSTLATHFLGDVVDVHLGGSDLLFPHHECEIAQVEPLSGRHPYVRYWMHVAMVRYEGEKMSKSLGNLVMVSDLLRTWNADTLRIYLAMHQYRQAWSHNEIELAQAENLAQKYRAALASPGGKNGLYNAKDREKDFAQSLDEDLNTPKALRALANLSSEIMVAAGNGQDIHEGQDILRSMGSVLGLSQREGKPDPHVMDGWNRHLERFPLPLQQ
jgi:L-cysteine:1D-myo-inositol 2-amino-2-deoxy-alpha-D-glucopyranoside ligase